MWILKMVAKIGLCFQNKSTFSPHLLNNKWIWHTIYKHNITI